MAAQTPAQLDPDLRSIDALLGAFEDPSIEVQSVSLVSLELLLSEVESGTQRDRIINGLSQIVQKATLDGPASPLHDRTIIRSSALISSPNLSQICADIAPDIGFTRKFPKEWCISEYGRLKKYFLWKLETSEIKQICERFGL